MCKNTVLHVKWWLFEHITRFADWLPGSVHVTQWHWLVDQWGGRHDQHVINACTLHGSEVGVALWRIDVIHAIRDQIHMRCIPNSSQSQLHSFNLLQINNPYIYILNCNYSYKLYFISVRSDRSVWITYRKKPEWHVWYGNHCKIIELLIHNPSEPTRRSGVVLLAINAKCVLTNDW